MRVFEYTFRSEFEKLSVEQKIFTAKMIMREVEKIAREKGITEEEAYACYQKGLFGGNRRI